MLGFGSSAWIRRDSVADNAVVQPATGTLNVVGQESAPFASEHKTVSPNVAALSLEGQAPTPVTPVVIVPPQGILGLSGNQPGINTSADPQPVAVMPPTGNLALTGQPPVIPNLPSVQGATASPNSGVLYATYGGQVLAFAVTPASGSPQRQITINGVISPITQNVQYILMWDGVIHQVNDLGKWYFYSPGQGYQGQGWPEESGDPRLTPSLITARLDAPMWNVDWGRHLTTTELTNIRSITKSIRLFDIPVPSGTYNTGNSFPTPSSVTRIIDLVDRALSVGFEAIQISPLGSNYHDWGAPFIDNPSDTASKNGHRDYLVAWANYIASRPTWAGKVILELMNEPYIFTGSNQQAVWWAIAQDWVNAIRAVQVDVQLSVMSNGYDNGNWSFFDQLVGSAPLSGGNIFFDVHEYTPTEFTYQGTPGKPAAGTAHYPGYGTSASFFQSKITALKNWMTTYSTQATISEMGAARFAPEPDRSNWIKDIWGPAKAAGIPAALWCDANDAGDNTWFNMYTGAVGSRTPDSFSVALYTFWG